MEIVEKLKRIQDASGFSQERLAREFGVSFATVNSWMNVRSSPRPKMQERIDRAFEFYVSGNSTINFSALAEKKQLVIEKRRVISNISDLFTTRTDLKKQFTLSLTYNTNRIEGSTLSESDTRAVLFDNTSLPNKTLIEQLEAKNHQAVLGQVFDVWLSAQGTHTIKKEHILRFHEILMNGIRDDAGLYRRHPVRIIGSNVPTANWQSVTMKMDDLIARVNDSNVEKDPIAHIARTHAQFEAIHPFADGSGRIGRVIMHMMALRENLPPILVKNERKTVYYKYLQKAQIEKDYRFLEDFVCDAILDSYKLIEETG